MVKTGRSLENLTKSIYDIICNKNKDIQIEGPRVKLESPDGEREFDVVLRSKVAGSEILTVVECRDYNSNLDVTNIDGFVSKMRDVNANKGIIVASKGFSKTARQKAKRLGIDLCIAQDNNSLENELANIGFDLPFVVTEIAKADIRIQGVFNVPNEVSFNPGALLEINGKPPHQHLLDAIQKGNVPLQETTEYIRYIPVTEDGECFVLLDDGTKLMYSECQLLINLTEINYLFGYTTQLPSTKKLANLSTNEIQVLIKPEDFIESINRAELAKYKSLDDIPYAGLINIKVFCSYGFEYGVNRLEKLA